MPKSIERYARLIDEKLADITVCDPAVGSGAFPVGMMTEIVRARSALTPYFNDVHQRTPYHFKRHAIQNCLYGVDIDPGAVEIAKLRLWLSLVVDEEDVKQIKPLPNLFYKIVTGNSLLGVEKDLFNQHLFQQLEKLKALFFDRSDQSEKSALRREIDDLIHQLTNGKAAFDFEIYFSEVFHRKGGFDVVIANPPYGADIDKMIAVLRPLYFEATRNYAEIYKMFMQLGIRKVQQNGIQTLITPNTFLAQPRYKDIRSVLLQLDIVKIVNLGEEVFENVIVPTCLSFIGRRSPSGAYGLPDEQARQILESNDMKVTYDPEVDVLRILFRDVPIEESDEDKPGVILDYDKDGNLVGMEVLNASQRVENPRGVDYAATAQFA